MVHYSLRKSSNTNAKHYPKNHNEWLNFKSLLLIQEKTANDTPLETVPSYCRGLAIDSTGTIYVAATGSRSVLKIKPTGNINVVLKTGIALDNLQGLLYFIMMFTFGVA
jgi:hypothetical protein